MKQTERKHPLGLSSLALKFIALFFMTLDHVGLLFFTRGEGPAPAEPYYALRAIGKMAFPIFAFVSVESIYHTKNPKKYMLRLLIAAVSLDLVGYITGAIAKIPVADNPILGNAFTDIFLGVVMVYFLKKKNWYSFFALIPFLYEFLSCIWINDSYGALFKTDWSAYSAVLFLFLFLSREIALHYLHKQANDIQIPDQDYEALYGKTAIKISESVGVLACGITFYLVYRLSGSTYFLPGRGEYVPIGTFSVISIVFLLFYNGERGYKDSHKAIRWFFYLYYPLHLLVLSLLSLRYGVLSSYLGEESLSILVATLPCFH